MYLNFIYERNPMFWILQFQAFPFLPFGVFAQPVVLMIPHGVNALVALKRI